MKLQTKQRIDHYLGGALVFFLRPVVYVIGRLTSRDHHLRVRKNLYFIKMVGGGSLILAFPALLGLRKRYPGVEFVLVTTPAVEPFARLLGIFDRIVLIDDRAFFAAIHTTICAWLDSWKADTYVDLEVYSRLTTVASTLSTARNRIGFYLETHFWRKHIHTHLIYFNRFAGVHLFYEQIARLLGATPASVDECREQLVGSMTMPAKPVRRRIAISHACSELGQERMLSTDQWLSVIDEKLTPQADAEVHFLGAQSDREFAAEIMQAAAPKLPNVSFFNHCGSETLAGSLALLASCQEFWGIDSAPLHLARILGIDSTSFWGPTHPETRLKPFLNLVEDVRYQRVSCSPCIHIAETPPCNGNNVCIAGIFAPQSKAQAPVQSPTWTPEDA